ncbi:TATA box-binding protein-associated factor RNA polymerase I subunit B [Ciona intestinalis]
MPVCPICDSNEYDICNGLYFCRICNTQSQDIVEQDVENAAEVAIGRFIDRKRRKKSKRVPNFTIDPGKPWFTVEGLQALLKRQVQTLISLGCSKRLDKVVQQIWFKYVHKCGMAVIDPEVPVSGKPAPQCSSFRDNYLNGVFGDNKPKDNPFPTTKNLVMLRASSLGKRRKESSSSSEEDPITPKKGRPKIKTPKKEEKERVVPSDEEWFSLASGAESAESDTSYYSSASTMSAASFKKLANKKFNHWGRERRKAGVLCKAKLLSILYVALQWCKELITPGDLLNWVKQGYIPYIDALLCLEPHMKISDYDGANLQRNIIPSYKQFVKVSRLLEEYVEMPPLPNVDISSLMARFVIQINLPLEIIPFINNLIRVNNFNYTRAKVRTTALTGYAPDLISCALIVVALKLLYGINDVTEWTSCNDNDNCDKNQENDETSHICQNFEWKSWMQYHLNRRKETMQNPKILFDVRDAETVVDLHSYFEHWDEVILNSQLHNKETTGGRHRLKSIETKQWVMRKLIEAQGSLDEIQRRAQLRENPFVFPAPTEEDDMKRICICSGMERIKSGSIEYVLVQNPNSNKQLKDRIHFTEYSDSYKFLLSIFSEITAAEREKIHHEVWKMEKYFILDCLKKEIKEKA